MADGDKVPTLGGILKNWFYSRFGRRGVAALAALGLAFYVWSNWDKVQTWAGIAWLVRRAGRDEVPTATPGRFAVMVARLQDDPERATEHLILRLVRGFEGVQVLSLDRMIAAAGPVPEDAERQGHAKAREYLKESGAAVLIWGGVLRHGDEERPELFLTAATGMAGKARQYAIETGSEFRLPAVFWEDLSKVVRLVIATQAEAIQADKGRYVADRLEPFISQIRGLLAAATTRPGWDADALIAARFALAAALGEYGEQTGQAAPLEEALTLYDTIVQELPRETAPADWAEAHNGRGVALLRLGERDSDPARLQQAADAFRQALQEWTREKAPLDWAGAQSNLGAVLVYLSERDGDTARLQAAEDALRAALEVRSRESHARAWAGTQNNLGLALFRLGEQEGGTARLEQAVDALRQALQVWTRAKAPLAWAMALSNLAGTLISLGEREGGTARFEQAVGACSAALQEWTREKAPLQWARIQRNLGNALFRWGEREGGSARLEQAAAALREALEVLTRDSAPMEWAGTQNTLGGVLWRLGEREGRITELRGAVARDGTPRSLFVSTKAGAARLRQAADAYREAQKEWTREKMPLQWARAERSCAAVFGALGELGDDRQLLEQAVAMLRDVLKELKREKAPYDWAATQSNLGYGLMALGAREDDTAHLDQAIAAFRAALEVFEATPSPLDTAKTRRGLARAEALLAERRAKVLTPPPP